MALGLLASNSWAAYNDTIQFSSANLGSTYALESGLTSPVLPVSGMAVGLTAHGRTDVFRGDTEPPTNIGAGVARTTAAYTLCNGCTLTVKADFYNRLLSPVQPANESYLYLSPVGATTWDINNALSQGVVIGSTLVVDGGDATQARWTHSPAGAIAQPYNTWSTLEVTLRRVDSGGTSQLQLVSVQRDGVVVSSLNNFNVSLGSGYNANWLASGFQIGVAADDMAHGLQVLQPEITVAKTSPGSSFVVNGPVQFDIDVRNTGLAPASNLVVNDVMPAGLTAVTWTCTASGGVACPAATGSGDIHHSLATLPAGAALVYRVNATAPAITGAVTNTVQVEAGTGVCAGDTAPPCLATVSLSGTLIAVPTNQPWALAILALALLGTAWQWRRHRAQ